MNSDEELKIQIAQGTILCVKGTIEQALIKQKKITPKDQREEKDASCDKIELYYEIPITPLKKPNSNEVSETVSIKVRKSVFFLKEYYKYFKIGHDSNSGETTYSSLMGYVYKEDKKTEAPYCYELYYYANSFDELNQLVDIRLYNPRYSERKNAFPCIPYRGQLTSTPISQLLAGKSNFVHENICLQGYVDANNPFENVFYQFYSEGLSKKVDNLPIYIKYWDKKIWGIADPEEIRKIINSKGFYINQRKPLKLRGNIQYSKQGKAYCIYVSKNHLIEAWYLGYYYLFINWLENNAGSYLIILLFAVMANFIYDCLKWLVGLLF